MENKVLPASSDDRRSLIVCRNSQGTEVRATILRLTRYLVVFEVYNPYSIIQLSEVLTDFKIIINERVLYSGRAVISNLVNTGIILICEATLDEAWLDVDFYSPVKEPERLQEHLREFFEEWEKVQRVTPEFKVVVADIQTLLADSRRWLEQLELSVRSEPAGDRQEIERSVVEELRKGMLPRVDSLFYQFEGISAKIASDLQPLHRTYVKRQLHPLLLCSPFMYRIYQKPLGYAGDYEMVNMILREPIEGSSLFAKVLNVYILSQCPAEAHRNRVRYLTRKLSEEARRVARQSRMARVFNLGCGPAKEVQNFLIEDDICDRVQLTLADFNDETLRFVESTIDEIKSKHRRSTQVNFVKKSVNQLLKDASRVTHTGPKYDMVYCAGLFDYFSDRVCKKLMNLFHEMLAPGGLLVATNVDASNPIKNIMEYIFEWHLVYRNQSQLKALVPEDAPCGTAQILRDQTGANVFVEIRKPENSI